MSDLKEPILGRNPEKVSISNSEIQTFKRCRRRWYLGNYRGLQPKEKSQIGPLPLGTRIHNALEKYYVDGSDPVEEYSRLMEIDRQLFLESDESRFESNGTKFEKEAELGRIMVEGYIEMLDETNADADIEVVGAEKKLSYRMMSVDERVELIGKVDLKIRRAFDGSRGTLDHKSAINFNDYYLYSHMSEQLLHYTFLEMMDPEGDSKVDGGIYNLLKKVKRSGTAKPPFYDRIDVRFNKHTLESFWIRLSGTIRDMMATRDALDAGSDHRYVAYPTPKMDWTCGKCPFLQVCPMLDDGSDAEGMIEDLFEQVDPNARYAEDENEATN